MARTISQIKQLLARLKANPLARFAYKENAYTNDTVEGAGMFNPEADNNINSADNSGYTSSVKDLGVRLQGTSIPQDWWNHFNGRTSYNLNKAVDLTADLTENVEKIQNGETPVEKSFALVLREDISKGIFCFLFDDDARLTLTSDEAGFNIFTDGGTIRTNGGSIETDNGTISTKGLNTNGGAIYTYGGDIRTNGGFIFTKGGYIRTNGGNIDTGDGTISTKGLNTAGGNIFTDGGDIETVNGTISTKGLSTNGGNINTVGGAILTQGGYIETGNGTISTKGLNTNGGNITTVGGNIETGNGTISTNGGIINTNGGAINTVGGKLVTNGGTIETGEGTISTKGLNTNGGNIETGEGGKIIAKYVFATNLNIVDIYGTDISDDSAWIFTQRVGGNYFIFSKPIRFKTDPAIWTDNGDRQWSFGGTFIDNPDRVTAYSNSGKKYFGLAAANWN